MNQENISQSVKSKVENITSERSDIDQVLSDFNLERAKPDEMLDSFDNCIIGYVEGSNALEDFKNNYHYIDGCDASFLLGINELGFSESEKNYFLMQIHDRVMKRAHDNTNPEFAIDPNDFSDLKHSIKINYIMRFNEIISAYIDQATRIGNRKDGRKEKNISNFRDELANGLLVASSCYHQDCSGLKDIDTNFGTKDNLNKLFGVIEGMRHEAAFRELISEISDDLIEYEETDKEQDSRGVDFVLKAKISEQKINGKYVYASSAEIENNQYIEMDLPLDIKSTSGAANKELSNIYKYANGNGHIERWAMWSHIYPEDFRLSISDYDGKPEVGYDKNEARIYLKYNEQIPAMRDLSNVKYYEDGEEFTPYSIDDRLTDIKREVLRGINEIHLHSTAVA